MSALVDHVDELYRSVVTDPEAWRDPEAFSRWLEDVVAAFETISREEARALRRALRTARRLQAFWAAVPASDESWEAKVDRALGAAAWRPTLELARLALEANPDPERFAEFAARFRLVHHRPVDLDFDAWTAGRHR